MTHHGRAEKHNECLSSSFARLPLDAMTDPELRPAHIVLLAWLDWYNFRLQSYPGHDVLAGDLRMSRRHTYELLDELESLGWISRAGGGPGATCTVHFPCPQGRLPGVRWSAPKGALERTPTVRQGAPQGCAGAHPSEEVRIDLIKRGFVHGGGSDSEWQALVAQLAHQEER